MSVIKIRELDMISPCVERKSNSEEFKMFPLKFIDPALEAESSDRK
ncbi:hypothetical protein [Rhizobium mesosinicum]|uniref:Uncharacterized protein n=1 Tax=Rhizobium mesosinicum TaxID=335017 RepID=A0ABS7GUW8_9HYPH|nr:hypothetical protein [Rhizobium mesosinicum]MBW9053752.1 hypothetical protein [Rhizobium mesosinicum]